MMETDQKKLFVKIYLLWQFKCRIRVSDFLTDGILVNVVTQVTWPGCIVFKVILKWPIFRSLSTFDIQSHIHLLSSSSREGNIIMSRIIRECLASIFSWIYNHGGVQQAKQTLNLNLDNLNLCWKQDNLRMCKALLFEFKKEKNSNIFPTENWVIYHPIIITKQMFL